MSPLVSIIIPVYNAEQTIAKCLTSIFDQTFRDYELLLIDDGSKDASLTLLKQYEATYPQVTVLTKPNSGASDTRNQGIAIAQGTYLVFIDSDDYIDENYLETLITEIEGEQLDMVISGIRKVDDKGRTLGEMKLGVTDWSKYIITSPCTRIIRKSFLEEHQLAFINYTMEDIHFNAVAFAKTSKIKTIPYVGYNNFVNPESTTRTAHRGIRKEIDILYILEAIRQEVQADDYLRFFYKKVALYYLLYTGKSSSAKVFLEEYSRVKKWFINHNFQKSMSPFDERLVDEGLVTRLVIFVFQFIECLGLVPLFAKLYCKGK